MPRFPEDDTRRWLAELRSLRERHPGIQVERTGASAIAEGTVSREERTTRFRLVWPPDFPLRPPVVWELDGDRVRNRGTKHVWADGSLCLYPHDPDAGWRPTRTAADALDQAAALLRAIDEGHVPPNGPVAHIVPGRLSVPPELYAALRSGGRFGLFQARARQDGSFVRVTGVDGTGAGVLRPGLHTAEPSRAWWEALGLTDHFAGLWVRVEDSKALDSEAALLAALGSAGNASVLLREASGLLVIAGDELRFAVLRESGAGTRNPWASIVYLPAVVEDLDVSLGARVRATLGERGLGDARVAIIGLGSLGSHVAIALARAGVRHFHLVDPEALAIENICRHACDLQDVGRSKVMAVGRAVLRIQPGAEVHPIQQRFSLEPTVMNGAMDALAGFFAGGGPRLVVGATATADVEHLLNHVAVSRGIPAVFGSVLGRAQHALVFRVLPGESPCFACVMTALEAEPGKYARFGEDIQGAYGGGGNPGLGIDVQEVAMLLARMGLQTLLRGEGYPDAHAHHLLWSRDGSWAVPGPLQTRVEPIPRDTECWVCGTARTQPLSAEELLELARLESGAPGSQPALLEPSSGEVSHESEILA